MIKFMIFLALGTIIAMIGVFLFSVAVMLTFKAITAAYEKLLGDHLNEVRR